MKGKKLFFVSSIAMLIINFAYDLGSYLVFAFDNQVFDLFLIDVSDSYLYRRDAGVAFEAVCTCVIVFMLVMVLAYIIMRYKNYAFKNKKTDKVWAVIINAISVAVSFFFYFNFWTLTYALIFALIKILLLALANVSIFMFLRKQYKVETLCK